MILSLFYWPDSFGIAPYTTQRAEFLASRGHEVTVCTAMPFYPEWKIRADYRKKAFVREIRNGVSIRRSILYVPSVVSSVKRLTHEATFAASSLTSALLTQRPDVIVVVSPPLSLALVGLALSRRWRVPYVFHVEDLQPDAAFDLGMLPKKGIATILYSFERLAYERAALVSTITDNIRDRIIAKGINPGKVAIFRQWADPELFAVDGDALGAAFRKGHGLDGQFLAVYSGNMGVKQGLDVVLDAAARTLNDDTIKYLLIGDGAVRAHLEEQARRQKLRNVNFLPPQPDAEYRKALFAADVALVTQLRTMADFAFPSKVVQLLAAGRPVVAAVNSASEVAKVLGRAEGGVVVEPESGESLANAIRALRADAPMRRRLAGSARFYARRVWNKERALVAMERALGELMEGGRLSSASPA